MKTISKLSNYIKNDKPVILGGNKLLSSPISLAGFIGQEEAEAVSSVLRSGELSGFVGSGCDEFYGGTNVRELENNWCNYFDCKYSISVNSATTGLFTALLALGISEGDEVILPPYTMSGSLASILFTRATPVFCDINDKTFCVSCDDIIKKITPKTKCIMTVNLFGSSPNYNELKKIAKKHNIKVIEDNAQAVGTKWDGKYTGTIGDIGVFSLNRHKNIQSGEGGIITTNNDLLAKKCMLIRNHGENAGDWLKVPVNEQYNTIGLNFRMTEMEAAVAKCQLEKLPMILKERQRVGLGLSKVFNSFPFFEVPFIDSNLDHSFHYFGILYNEKLAKLSRSNFSKALAMEGFPNRVGYLKPLYGLNVLERLKQPKKNKQFFNVRSTEKLNNVELIEEKMILCGFMSPRMTDRQISELNSVLCRIFRNAKKIQESIEN